MSSPAPVVAVNRRAGMLAGLLLIASALLEYAIARHYWGQRIPRGWAWSALFVGTATPPGPDGLFPPHDATVIYERRLKLVDESTRPRRVVVSDAYRNLEPRTGRVIYDYTVRFSVDPRTGRHLPPHQGDYLVFPRDTQRRTYPMRLTYLKGVPLAFDGEDEVEGLRVYRFRYSGPMEYTDFYRGSGEVPGMTVAADQEIRCWDDRYEVTFWVEPMTGMAVKLAEACRSADVLVDRRGRAFRANVLRWSAEAAGNDVVARVEEAWSKRLWMQVTLRYLPLALLALGLLCAAPAVRATWRARRVPPA